MADTLCLVIITDRKDKIKGKGKQQEIKGEETERKNIAVHLLPGCHMTENNHLIIIISFIFYIITKFCS